MGVERRGRSLHSRWPLGAAAGAATTVATLRSALKRRDTLLPHLALLVLFCHQVEEWLWPSGFQRWFNRRVVRAAAPDRPLDERAGFAVNVIGGWGSGVAALAFGRRLPALLCLVGGSHLANASLHLTYALRDRTPNPGTFTALPLGALGYALCRQAECDAGQKAAATAAGLLTIPALILRFRAQAGASPSTA